MRIEIKYFIASIFVGLCAVLYQTVSYQDFIPNVFKKIQKNNNQIEQHGITSPISVGTIINRNARDSRMNQLASGSQNLEDLPIPVYFTTFDQSVGHTPDFKKNLVKGPMQDVAVNKGSLNGGSAMAPFPSASYNQLDQGYPDNAQSYPDYFGYYPSSNSTGTSNSPRSSSVGQPTSAANSAVALGQGSSGGGDIEPVQGHVIGAGPKKSSSTYIKSPHYRKPAVQKNIDAEQNITSAQEPSTIDQNSKLKAAASIATGLAAIPLWEKLKNYVKNKFWGKKIDADKLSAVPGLEVSESEALETMPDEQRSSDNASGYVPMLGYEPSGDLRNSQENISKGPEQQENHTQTMTEELFDQTAQKISSPEKQLKTVPKKTVHNIGLNNNQPVQLQPSASNVKPLPSLPSTEQPSSLPSATRRDLPILSDSSSTVHAQQLPEGKNSSELVLPETQPTPQLSSGALSNYFVKNLHRFVSAAAYAAQYAIPVLAVGKGLYQEHQANKLLEAGITSAGEQALVNFKPTEQPTLVTDAQPARALPNAVKAVIGEQGVKLLETGLGRGGFKPPLIVP